jgi:branched-chain amino acid transport system permease protein
MAAVFAFGVLIERVLLTPLYSERTERKDEYGLIVTFGLAFFLRNTALIVFGPFPLKPPSFATGVQHIGTMILTDDRVFAGSVGLVLLAVLLYFMNRTIWGQALDAVSQSRDAAAIVGIDPARFNTLAFGVGAALAAGAGALIAPLFSLAPDMGVSANIQAYVIVILGGMGSVLGSILGGLVLGESEGLFTAFFPDPTRALAYTNAFGVLVLMGVLVFRPTGLFGRRHVRME